MTEKKRAPTSMADIDPNIQYVLAHHDSQITALNDRMSGVESKLDTVIRAVNDVAGQLKVEASRPQLDFSKLLTSIKDIAVMIGLCVAAIIWVTSGQFNQSFSTIEERERALVTKVNQHDSDIRELREKVTRFGERWTWGKSLRE